MDRSYTIKNMKYPAGGDIDRDIEWLCVALGLSGKRDKNRVAVSIFKHVIRKGTVSEDELARILKVSRTTIAHHMEKMIMSGLVRKERGIYSLSGNSLEEMLEDMKADIISAIERIKRIAREIDRKYRLRGRA